MSNTKSAYKPLRFLFLIILGVSAITLISKKSKGEDKIPWRTDLAAARDEAARDGKPVLLYFTASWCGPCQMMKSETFTEATVETKLRDVVPVKIDVDENGPLAQQYNINSVPTFIVLGKEGNPSKETSGFMAAHEFLTWIGG